MYTGTTDGTLDLDALAASTEVISLSGVSVPGLYHRSRIARARDQKELSAQPLNRVSWRLGQSLKQLNEPIDEIRTC